MKLGVVILNWNAAEDTAACLRAVQGWRTMGLSVRPVLWVVDNGSRGAGRRAGPVGVPRGPLPCEWSGPGLLRKQVLYRPDVQISSRSERERAPITHLHDRPSAQLCRLLASVDAPVPSLV